MRGVREVKNSFCIAALLEGRIKMAKSGNEFVNEKKRRGRELYFLFALFLAVGLASDVHAKNLGVHQLPNGGMAR
jgi:hypothetical protein